MIRYRSRLIQVFSYYTIPLFYNSYATLLVIIRRKKIWIRVYRIIWASVIRYYFSWGLLIKYMIKYIKHYFIYYLYKLLFSYIYFAFSNQFMLINYPLFLRQLNYYKFNLVYYFWQNFKFISFLLTTVMWTDMISTWGGFLWLKYMKSINLSISLIYYKIISNQSVCLFYLFYWKVLLSKNIYFYTPNSIIPVVESIYDIHNIMYNIVLQVITVYYQIILYTLLWLLF